MSTPTAPTICIVLGEHLSNYYTGPIVQGAVAAGSALGCRLLLYSPLNTHLTHLGLTLDDLPLLPSGADAYLLPAYVAEEITAYCLQSGASVLFYSGIQPGQPSLGPDNRAGGRAATIHLIDHGRRRIAHLLGLPDSKESDERHAGYREALAAAAIPYDPALVARANFSLLGAEEVVEGLLRERIAFDALFASNDMSAMGAVNALRRSGVRVPEDVAVVGFDDSTISATFSPPLTTVRQSPFQIGWEGVRLLAAAALGNAVPQRSLIPTQLVVRASCGCAPGGAARDEMAQLALGLGATGVVVAPAEAAGWVAPLGPALQKGEDLVALVEGMVAEAEGRGWYSSALRGYLDRLHGQGGAAADRRLWQALGHLAALSEARNQRRQIDRANRVNAINYVIDLLREYSPDQSVEAALRYLITSGPPASIGVQRGPGETVVAQRIDELNLAVPWQGPLAAFPPPNWLAPGEVLLLMPLEAGAQQRSLVGIVEREGREHLDLDDLLLRSINTYRSITVLDQTLRELDAARSVQLSLLPRSAPQSEDYDIAGATRPARQVGGDLYGYYVRPTGALALALGDVAGKGMPAALLMSACATALAGTIPAGLAPSLTLSQIHQLLQPSVARGQNAAVCLVYLDGPRVRIANAGAVAPLVRGAGGVRLVDIGGVPLGTPLSGLAPYREVEEPLAPGDILVLSSDGIVEAMDESGVLYGFERFAAAIASGPTHSAQAMLTHLFADVLAFVGEADMRDDMALVVARYSGG